MVHIGRGIYCKKITLYEAQSGALNARQLDRRLIQGVFKLEAVKICTFTGAAYRPTVKTTSPSKRPKAIHTVAKNAIIGEFAFKIQRFCR